MRIIVLLKYILDKEIPYHQQILEKKVTKIATYNSRKSTRRHIRQVKGCLRSCWYKVVQKYVIRVICERAVKRITHKVLGISFT